MPKMPIKTAPDQSLFNSHATDLSIVVQVLDEHFNPGLKGQDRKVGFIVLTFPFGDVGDGRCNYASNGADKMDAAKLLRETADHISRNGMNSHQVPYSHLGKNTTGK
jgi:hypothetical protein